jgi:hypothetical protein
MADVEGTSRGADVKHDGNKSRKHHPKLSGGNYQSNIWRCVYNKWLEKPQKIKNISGK